MPNCLDDCGFDDEVAMGSFIEYDGEHDEAIRCVDDDNTQDAIQCPYMKFPFTKPSQAVSSLYKSLLSFKSLHKTSQVACVGQTMLILNVTPSKYNYFTRGVCRESLYTMNLVRSLPIV